MSGFDPGRYGERIEELLRPRRLAPLDQGRPNPSTRGLLAALADAQDFLGKPVRDPRMADACRAGIWLYHDFLEEAHAISQEITSTAGRYWHGLMHRREPDFSNSAYWFRRVGNFPIFDELAEAAREIAGDDPPEWAAFLKNSRWEPCAFIQLCEQALEGKIPAVGLCQKIQLREWELLFDYCYRAAVGYE
ncbi:MAG: hypothetical protein EXR99_07545 [Gemmataceae bacterium]|nr:hypothetical protein [Gemmataceae bacterium]